MDDSLQIPVIASSVNGIHSGRLKTLTNFARGLNSDLLIFTEDSNIISSELKHNKVMFFKDKIDLTEYLNNSNYKYTLIDDKDLALYEKIDKDIISFVYPMWGLWQIGGLPLSYIRSNVVKGRRIFLKYSGIGGLLKHEYVKNIKKSKHIFTQSFTASGILRYYYGISPDGILLDPVDTSVFKPVNEAESKYSSNKVLLYLGSGDGDTFTDLIPSISKLLSKHGFSIQILGNKKNLEYVGEVDYTYFENVSDEEVADLYNQAKFSITPQIDEPGGYVPMESAATGTPCIASYPQDAVSFNGALVTASKKNFLKTIERMITDRLSFRDYSALRDLSISASSNFTIEAVSSKLQEYMCLLR